MGFADQKYYTRTTEQLIVNASAGTATASSTIGANVPFGNSASFLIPMERKTAVSKIKVAVVSAPSANVTALALQFVTNTVSGTTTTTNTFATITVGTNTAGAILDGTAVGSAGGSAVPAASTNLYEVYKTVTLPNSGTTTVMQGTNTNAIVPINQYVTIFVTGTATASGATQALGSYEIAWEARELFDSQIVA